MYDLKKQFFDCNHDHDFQYYFNPKSSISSSSKKWTESLSVKNSRYLNVELLEPNFILKKK